MAVKKFKTIRDKNLETKSDTYIKDKMELLEVIETNHDETIEMALIKKLMSTADDMVDEVSTISLTAGPKGDTGSQGVKGDTGSAGAKGDTGAAGTNGSAGA